MLAVSLRYCIVDAGYRGELVAQLLILLALDRVAERKSAMPNSRVVTVNDFLKELLGSNYAAVDDFMDSGSKKADGRRDISDTFSTAHIPSKPETVV